jgi:META domain
MKSPPARSVGVVRKVTAGIALGAVALAGATASAHAGSEGEELFGPAFKSVRVVKDGERHPLFDDATVRLKFADHDRRDFASWRVDCNFFGARVDVGPERLELRRPYSTLIGCDRRRARQDRWLANFMTADPRWSLDGRILKLGEGDDRIVLRRRAPD